jgi:uncharacterized membrane protein YebE (DUF533 family)
MTFPLLIVWRRGDQAPAEHLTAATARAATAIRRRRRRAPRDQTGHAILAAAFKEHSPMIDPKSLLDQLLGGGAGAGAGGFARDARQKLQSSGLNSFGGGAALGGVVGLLLGGKSMRRLAGGAMGYGGAAALGALALRAYQNYQQGKLAQAVAPATLDELSQTPASQLPHALPAADGSPFELLLLRAMIGAAKSDGQVDAQEQQHVFEQVERMGLDAEGKAAVFDLLAKPLDLSTLDASIGNEAQRAEIYLAARLATDGNHPGERAYLDALASRLQLPAPLRAHLDSQLPTA